ncbi:MAG: amidohydrolase family protein [Bacteroidia bacterium]|nr:amidohydrolase family protein [Bacteroidia bacterium]
MTAPSGAFCPEWLYYEGRLWRRPTVYLKAGHIVQISDSPHPEAQWVSGLLSPCWVNAHTHLELSHLKAKIAPGHGMIDFIERMGPQRGAARAESIYEAIQAAIQEGTCAFVSHQNTPLPSQAILREACVQPLAEFFGLRGREARQRWRRLQRWGYPCTPHSFYALSRPLLRRARLPTTFPRSIHFFESVEEALWLERGAGPFYSFLRRFRRHPRPVKWLMHLRQMYRRAPALWLVHSTEVPRSHMEKLLKRFPQLYVVLCPEANLYLFRRLPDMEFWRRYPDRILLGTDSLANSPSLSIWGALRRLYMSGFSWEMALRAVVDTPRRWLSPPPLWVRVAPLGAHAEMLPESRPELFQG